MHPGPSLFLPIFLLLPLLATAQQNLTSKGIDMPSLVADTLFQADKSAVLSFKQSSVSPDTAKATLRVRILEQGDGRAPIQGATVLLKRDKDKMLGRVTKHDGRCLFSPSAALYSVRVQMTGLKTLERNGIWLEAGKVYDLEILMAKN